jgi:hypothetical protein
MRYIIPVATEQHRNQDNNGAGQVYHSFLVNSGALRHVSISLLAILMGFTCRFNMISKPWNMLLLLPAYAAAGGGGFSSVSSDHLVVPLKR